VSDPAVPPGLIGVRGLRGSVALERLEDVRAAAKDWPTFSSRVQGDPDVRTYAQLPLEVDPPEHGAYRAIIEPILGRRAVAALEPEIRAIARDVVGRFAQRGTAEAVTELATPMVGRTIAAVLRRPQDGAELTSWGLTSWEIRPDGSRSGSRLHAYIDRALDEAASVAAATATLGDGDPPDAFAYLAAAQIDGRPLSRLEQVGFASLLLAGGRDTVIHTLCGAMWHLAQEPADRAALTTGPAGLQLAIEEYARYLSPNAGMERRATADVAGGWGSARAGDLVVLGWGPANHDPSVFESPGEIRLDRRPNPHVAFGSGPHTCIGIHLARLEVRVFLEQLLALVPDWRLAEGMRMATVRLAGDVVPATWAALPLEASRPGDAPVHA
jgi:cytochrome P450